MGLRKLVLIACILLSVVLFTNGVYVLEYLGRKQLPESGETRFQPEALHFESSTEDDRPVNLLVLGVDEEGLRTDVILLFNYDPKLSKLNILSIARDTRVYARGRYSKINALYSAGEEEMVALEVQQITGLPVQFYMTMNFKGFRQIVDTLGGVLFDVPFNMDYDDPTQSLHIHLDKGMQLLNGSRAEQLVRYRKGNRQGQGYNDGDIGRIKMQQEFLIALIQQKVKLKYLSKASEIFNILKEYVKTNINLADLTHYLGSIRMVKSEDIKTFTLPGDSVFKNDIWYFIYDEEKTELLIKDNFY